jgi:hypothetical protein
MIHRQVFRVAIAAVLMGCGPAAFAYDAGMPNPPARPTRVRCGVVVLDVIDIDDVNEAFEAELMLVATWHDPRLAFDAAAEGTPRKIFQGAYQCNEVFRGWLPQFLIMNQAGGGAADVIKIEVDPDGRVRYSEARSALLETPMQLQAFPFDTQWLRIGMAPFGNPLDEVVLEVDQDYAETTNDLVRRNESIDVADWRLERLEMVADEVYVSAGGRQERYSRLLTTIQLRRRSWQLVWQMVFPLLVLVSMIWSIFWIDIESLPDRLNVSFIGVLTIVAYQFVVIDHMPNMSYLTFIDALLLNSFVAMAATIPQSLLIHRLVRKGKQAKAQKIDRICRWAFPLCYVISIAALAVWFLQPFR